MTFGFSCPQLFKEKRNPDFSSLITNKQINMNYYLNDK